MKKVLLLVLFFVSINAYSQSVGIGTSFPNPSAILDIKDSTRGILIPRMDSIHRKNIPHTKGMMVYDTTTNCFWFNTGVAWSKMITSACNLSVGDYYAGGIIFYLDGSGCHGLACATVDQSTGSAWGSSTYTEQNAWADGIGAGKGNTMMIKQYPAASLCLNYTGGGFNDWYLPSRFELSLMYQNLKLVGDQGSLAYNYYWSSSEFSFYNAHYQNFYNGLQGHILKNTSFHVRAVRMF